MIVLGERARRVHLEKVLERHSVHRVLEYPVEPAAPDGALLAVART